MNPVDELYAFQSLLEKGKSVTDIAARFGVTDAVVSRRLALARVSPFLLRKYGDGLINLDLLQAFTMTDDHATQQEVWGELQPWDRKAQTIRRMLSHDEIPASD